MPIQTFSNAHSNHPVCDKEVPTARPALHLSTQKLYSHAQQIHPYPSQVFFLSSDDFCFLVKPREIIAQGEVHQKRDIVDTKTHA